MSVLPDNIWIYEIFPLLEIEDRQRLRRVDKRFHCFIKRIAIDDRDYHIMSKILSSLRKFNSFNGEPNDLALMDIIVSQYSYYYISINTVLKLATNYLSFPIAIIPKLLNAVIISGGSELEVSVVGYFFREDLHKHIIAELFYRTIRIMYKISWTDQNIKERYIELIQENRDTWIKVLSSYIYKHQPNSYSYIS